MIPGLLGPVLGGMALGRRPLEPGEHYPKPESWPPDALGVLSRGICGHYALRPLPPQLLPVAEKVEAQWCGLPCDDCRPQALLDLLGRAAELVRDHWGPERVAVDRHGADCYPDESSVQLNLYGALMRARYELHGLRRTEETDPLLAQVLLGLGEQLDLASPNGTFAEPLCAWCAELGDRREQALLELASFAAQVVAHYQRGTYAGPSVAARHPVYA